MGCLSGTVSRSLWLTCVACSKDAPEPTIGQLTESWQNLTSHPDSDWTVNWEFVWLGDILRAMGHLLPEGGPRSVGQ